MTKKIFKILGKSLLTLLIISALLLIVGVNLPIENYQHKKQKIPKLLIENCNIIDTKNGLTIKNQNIYINNGLIVAIDSTPIINQAGYKIIDGKNKFVMSTLWDMHVHTLSLSPQLHFPLLIDNGVTNIRDMGDGDSWISDIDAHLEKTKIFGRNKY
ncbi:MAG: hypothetical protein U5N85_14110 [Arcicella sp.]|nr:hypothetical protein [Arcicella sp.]